MINFPKLLGASNKIATAGLPRATEPWIFFRICQTDIKYKLKVKKIHPTQIYAFWNFSKSLSWGGDGGGGGVLAPLPPHPSEVEIGLNTAIKAWLTFLEVKIQKGKYNWCI